MASLNKCSATSFPVAVFISNNNSFILCPSLNLKGFEREQVNDIWPYRESFIICPGAYNSIYSSFNASFVKVHLYITVRQYGAFKKQFYSMKSISFSQLFTSAYEVWSLLYIWSLLPFDTQWITTMKGVFRNTETLPFTVLPVRFPKCVAGHLLPWLPLFLASGTSLLHLFKNNWTHCRRIHSELLKFSKDSQVSKVSKQSTPSLSQCRGPTRSCFKFVCSGMTDQFFFSKNPATYNFIYFLNLLKLGCPMLLANYLKGNSFCFNLIGASSSAPPKSNESLLSASCSNSSE